MSRAPRSIRLALRERKRQLIRSGVSCVRCSVKLNESNIVQEMIRSHVEGGLEEPDNLVLVCARCSKRASHPEWRVGSVVRIKLPKDRIEAISAAAVRLGLPEWRLLARFIKVGLSTLEKS